MRAASLAVLALLAGCDDYVLDTSGTDGAGTRTETILALTGDATSGEVVFDDHCKLCHDKAGAVKTVGPALEPAVSASDDETLLAVILDGTGAMPAQDIAEDQDVADLLAWMRQTWP